MAKPTHIKRVQKKVRAKLDLVTRDKQVLQDASRRGFTHSVGSGSTIYAKTLLKWKNPRTLMVETLKWEDSRRRRAKTDTYTYLGHYDPKTKMVFLLKELDGKSGQVSPRPVYRKSKRIAIDPADLLRSGFADVVFKELYIYRTKNK